MNTVIVICGILALLATTILFRELDKAEKVMTPEQRRAQRAEHARWYNDYIRRNRGARLPDERSL